MTIQELFALEPSVVKLDNEPDNYILSFKQDLTHQQFRRIQELIQENLKGLARQLHSSGHRC